MNSTSHLLFAALPDHPSLSDTISFQLSGLVVVFLVLGSIWFLLSIMGKIFTALNAKAAAKTKVPSTAGADKGVPATPAQPNLAAATTVADENNIPPEIVAMIAAAVHLTVGARHRIVAITPAPHNPYWAMEGRRQIFASHRPR